MKSVWTVQYRTLPTLTSRLYRGLSRAKWISTTMTDFSVTTMLYHMARAPSSFHAACPRCSMEPGRTARAGWIGRTSAGTSVRFRLQGRFRTAAKPPKQHAKPMPIAAWSECWRDGIPANKDQVSTDRDMAEKTSQVAVQRHTQLQRRYRLSNEDMRKWK